MRSVMHTERCCTYSVSSFVAIAARLSPLSWLLSLVRWYSVAVATGTCPMGWRQRWGTTFPIMQSTAQTPITVGYRHTTCHDAFQNVAPVPVQIHTRILHDLTPCRCTSVTRQALACQLCCSLRQLLLWMHVQMLLLLLWCLPAVAIPARCVTLRLLPLQSSPPPLSLSCIQCS